MDPGGAIFKQLVLIIVLHTSFPVSVVVAFVTNYKFSTGRVKRVSAYV